MSFLCEHTGIVMGLLLAVAGLLVWRFPRLVRGYYFVSPDGEKEADWQGLRRFLLLGFLVLGLLTALLDVLIRNQETSYAVRLTVVFVGVLALIGAGRRYTHPKK